VIADVVFQEFAHQVIDRPRRAASL
jgi:hypothetical protein